MAIASGAAGIYSDDFAGAEWAAAQPPTSSVNWEWSALSSGGTLTHEIAGSEYRAVLYVPGATGKTWDSATRTAPALRQSCTDANFVIQAKMDDQLNANGMEMGLFVCNSDESAAYSVGFYYSTALHLVAQNNAAGTAPSDNTSSLTAPCYLRLTWDTSANTLGCEAQQNDSGWGTPFYTFTGLSSFVPAWVGLYVATWGVVPDHTRKFDYFFENSAPISQEDQVASTRRVFIIS